MRKSFAARLSRIEGLADLQVEKQVRIPQLEIMVDYTRAALYGLQPQAVTEHLERLSNGRVVSKLVDGTRRFDVVMRLNDSQRTTQGLGDLLLETPYGWVPVRHIAEIREGDGPNQILRENSKRRVVVLANADGSANMTRAHRGHTPRAGGDPTSARGSSPRSKARSRPRRKRAAPSLSSRCFRWR